MLEHQLTPPPPAANKEDRAGPWLSGCPPPPGVRMTGKVGLGSGNSSPGALERDPQLGLPWALPFRGSCVHCSSDAGELPGTPPRTPV